MSTDTEQLDVEEDLIATDADLIKRHCFEYAQFANCFDSLGGESRHDKLLDLLL